MFNSNNKDRRNSSSRRQPAKPSNMKVRMGCRVRVISSRSSTSAFPRLPIFNFSPDPFNITLSLKDARGYHLCRRCFVGSWWRLLCRQGHERVHKVYPPPHVQAFKFCLLRSPIEQVRLPQSKFLRAFSDAMPHMNPKIAGQEHRR